MSNGVVIKVDEKRLEGLAGELGGLYRSLSTIRSRLEELHGELKGSWHDNAAEEFSKQYEVGMEQLWDLLVVVDNAEQFFTKAASGYAAADKEVMSL